MKWVKHFLTILLFGLLCMSVTAQKMITDNVHLPDTTISISPDTTVQKRNVWQKFIGYFADANKPKPRKKFDFSIIGGPHYSNDTQFGIGLVAAGLYTTDLHDTIMPPSNVSLYGDVSTTGFYLLGIKGTHLFPKDKYRLLYNLYFFSFPGYFWGMGYNDGANKDNKSNYKRLQNQIKVDFLFRIKKGLYAGPSASFDYVEGKDFSKPELLRGQSYKTLSYGVGASIQYDTRDNITNAYKGVYLKLEQNLYPGFLGNKNIFYRTDFVADFFKKVWNGGILAFDIHAQFNYGESVPWTMMSRLGGAYRMRGYYEGQYRDNNITEFQVELRQHIWRRNGIAIWAGAGNVYKDFRTFEWRHTLPNFGFGYRWEFKKRVNVRLDLGFGKKCTGFMFNINEAF